MDSFRVTLIMRHSDGCMCLGRIYLCSTYAGEGRGRRFYPSWVIAHSVRGQLIVLEFDGWCDRAKRANKKNKCTKTLDTSTTRTNATTLSLDIRIICIVIFNTHILIFRDVIFFPEAADLWSSIYLNKAYLVKINRTVYLHGEQTHSRGLGRKNIGTWPFLSRMFCAFQSMTKPTV